MNIEKTLIFVLIVYLSIMVMLIFKLKKMANVKKNILNGIWVSNDEIYEFNEDNIKIISNKNTKSGYYLLLKDKKIEYSDNIKNYLYSNVIMKEKNIRLFIETENEFIIYSAVLLNKNILFLIDETKNNEIKLTRKKAVSF